VEAGDEAIASASLFGNDTDDAPSWADNAGPNNMTVTAAFTTLNIATSGTKPLDVTTIVQEIVNRAGWVANNDMAFGVNGTIIGAGVGYLTDSVDASPGDDPVLEIIYGGAGRTTKNTRDFTHGINVGMGWRMPV
jgi:3',5'-cyclic AMP phosphodiesterase CpdA